MSPALHLCWSSEAKVSETLSRGLRELFPVEPVPPDLLALLQALDAKLEPRTEATPDLPALATAK